MIATLLAAMALGAAADQWAVIAVGSSGYGNYRHQANGCHAYHLLLSHGLSPDKIILMSYNDVANSRSNPFPGKLFNHPTSGAEGHDYYAGCVVDYEGSKVTADLFMKVITGDAAGVKQLTGKSKVLASNSNDDVFLNFIDHGGPGIIAFPVGNVLTSQQLSTSLQTMQKKQMFSQLTFYMEACESGSMFPDLTSSGKILAVTAANAQESSWGTYCPPEDKIGNKDMGTCLGDLFSINWMEDTDSHSDMTETLQTQIATVKRETSKSHVQVFGDTSFQTEPIGDFQGATPAALKSTGLSKSTKDVSAVASRDIPLHRLWYQWQRASPEEKLAALQRVVRAAAERERIDGFWKALAEAICTGKNGCAESLIAAKHEMSKGVMECHHHALEAMGSCQKKWADDHGYGFQHIQYIVNACSTMDQASVVSAASKACGALEQTTIII